MQNNPHSATTDVTLTDWERIAIAALCRKQIDSRLNRTRRNEGDELDRMRWHTEIGLLQRLCGKMGEEFHEYLD